MVSEDFEHPDLRSLMELLLTHRIMVMKLELAQEIAARIDSTNQEQQQPGQHGAAAASNLQHGWFRNHTRSYVEICLGGAQDGAEHKRVP